MFRSLKEKISGAFQHNHKETDISAGTDPSLSSSPSSSSMLPPPRWPFSTGGGPSTTARRDEEASLSPSFSSPADGALTDFLARYPAVPPTPSPQPESFLGGSTTCAQPKAAASTTTRATNPFSSPSSSSPADEPLKNFLSRYPAIPRRPLPSPESPPGHFRSSHGQSQATAATGAAGGHAAMEDGSGPAGAPPPIYLPQFDFSPLMPQNDDPASPPPPRYTSLLNTSPLIPQDNSPISAPAPRYTSSFATNPPIPMVTAPESGPPPNHHSNANSAVAGVLGPGLNPVPQPPPPRQTMTDQGQRPAGPSQNVPPRNNYYRAVSADIMAGFDSPQSTPQPVPEVTGTATPSAPSPPPARRGYLPIAASILDYIDGNPFSPQTTGGSSSTAASTSTTASTSTAASTLPPLSPPIQRRPKQHRAPPGLGSPGSNNPFVGLLEQKEQAMTVAFLLRQDSVSGPQRAGLTADDFSFGQRYQQAADTTDVVVTSQRLPINDLSGPRECTICAETRDVSAFPILSVTRNCEHPPGACLECLQMSIRSDLNSKLWTEIRCPECRELLDYVDIQKYADKETFARYEALALHAAMGEAENFIWCTANCGSGQLHDTGAAQPIVTCLHCRQRSCFTHNVAWHDDMTCEEYDALQRDPENFRSRIEIENDELERARRAQEDADRAMAQSLVAEQKAETRRREARERAERERERAERERARNAAALARKAAARRKAEEDKSRETVNRTTKPCPGCGWAIEKNDGCSHMTCSKCKHNFCYECGADHRRILQGDNSVHREDCRFHPNNLSD